MADNSQEDGVNDREEGEIDDSSLEDVSSDEDFNFIDKKSLRSIPSRRNSNENFVMPSYVHSLVYKRAVPPVSNQVQEEENRSYIHANQYKRKRTHYMSFLHTSVGVSRRIHQSKRHRERKGLRKNQNQKHGRVMKDTTILKKIKHKRKHKKRQAFVINRDTSVKSLSARIRNMLNTSNTVDNSCQGLTNENPQEYNISADLIDNKEMTSKKSIDDLILLETPMEVIDLNSSDDDHKNTSQVDEEKKLNNGKKNKLNDCKENEGSESKLNDDNKNISNDSREIESKDAEEENVIILGAREAEGNEEKVPDDNKLEIIEKESECYQEIRLCDVKKKPNKKKEVCSSTSENFPNTKIMEDDDELQLRLLALRSAILKKHIKRVKTNDTCKFHSSFKEDDEVSCDSPSESVEQGEILSPVDMEIADTDEENDTLKLRKITEGCSENMISETVLSSISENNFQPTSSDFLSSPVEQWGSEHSNSFLSLNSSQESAFFEHTNYSQFVPVNCVDNYSCSASMVSTFHADKHEICNYNCLNSGGNVLCHVPFNTHNIVETGDKYWENNETLRNNEQNVCNSNLPKSMVPLQRKQKSQNNQVVKSNYCVPQGYLGKQSADNKVDSQSHVISNVRKRKHFIDSKWKPKIPNMQDNAALLPLKRKRVINSTFMNNKLLKKYRKQKCASRSFVPRLESANKNQSLMKVTLPLKKIHSSNVLSHGTSNRFVISLKNDSESDDENIEMTSPQHENQHVSEKHLNSQSNFEESIDVLLKQLRQKQESEKSRFCTYSDANATETSSGCTPAVIKTLPQSQLEEYRRLREQMTKLEKEHRVRMQQLVARSPQSNCGNKKLKHSITTILPRVSSPAKLQCNSATVEQKEILSSYDKTHSKTETVARNSSQVKRSLKYPFSSASTVTNFGGYKSMLIDKTMKYRNIKAKLESSKKDFVPASGTALKSQSSSHILGYHKPKIIATIKSMDVQETALSNNDSACKNSTIQDGSADDITSVQKDSNDSEDAFYKEESEEEMKLSDYEVQLLNHRCEVLDDLAKILDSLNDLECEIQAEESISAEVTRLKQELSAAELRLENQRKLVLSMEVNATHARSQIMQGKSSCLSLSKKCLMLGIQSRGKHYKVPSVGLELLNSKFEQFADMFQRIYKRKCKNSFKEGKIPLRTDSGGSDKSNLKQLSHNNSEAEAVLTSTESDTLQTTSSTSDQSNNILQDTANKIDDMQTTNGKSESSVCCTEVLSVTDSDMIIKENSEVLKTSELSPVLHMTNKLGYSENTGVSREDPLQQQNNYTIFSLNCESAIHKQDAIDQDCLHELAFPSKDIVFNDLDADKVSVSTGNARGAVDSNILILEVNDILNNVPCMSDEDDKAKAEELKVKSFDLDTIVQRDKMLLESDVILKNTKDLKFSPEFSLLKDHEQSNKFLGANSKAHHCDSHAVLHTNKLPNIEYKNLSGNVNISSLESVILTGTEPSKNVNGEMEAHMHVKSEHLCNKCNPHQKVNECVEIQLIHLDCSSEPCLENKNFVKSTHEEHALVPLSTKFKILGIEDQSKTDTSSQLYSIFQHFDEENKSQEEHIDPFLPICPFDLMGSCNDEGCMFQHLQRISRNRKYES